VVLAVAGGFVLYEGGRRAAVPTLQVRTDASARPGGQAPELKRDPAWGTAVLDEKPADEDDELLVDAAVEKQPRSPRGGAKQRARVLAAPDPDGDRPCLLAIQGGPPGARVMVDGALQGTLPLGAPLELEPGRGHSLVVRSGTLEPYTYRLACRPGERLKLELKVR
jgi:hypothetical protein